MNGHKSHDILIEALSSSAQKGHLIGSSCGALGVVRKNKEEGGKSSWHTISISQWKEKKMLGHWSLVNGKRKVL